MKTGPARFHPGVLPAVLHSLCFLVSSAGAQGETDLQIHRSRDSGLATFVVAQDGGPIFVIPEGGGVASPIADAGLFLDRFGRLFGIENRTGQLLAGNPERDLLGRTHTKFVQVERGVPVFSGQLRVHQDEHGRVYAANGAFRPIPQKLSVRPSITAEQAVAIAAESFDAAKFETIRSEMVIVDPGWYGDAPVGPQLAYYIGLEDTDGMLSQLYFVDAHSGKILDQWSAVESYRSRQIFHGLLTTDLPGTAARFENDPAVTNAPDVNRAFDYYGDTYDYFWRGFGRDSMDGLGLPMVATVYSTAPGCPNAFWSSSRKQMAFCAGTVTDDITAHELTHGLTYYTAELIYQNQSGQLNESYSDVFGELVDLFNGDAAFVLGDSSWSWPDHPTGPGADELNSIRTECSPNVDYHDGVRWLLGEDALAFGGAIRDLWEPTCLGDPDRALSPSQTCGPGDNGGVHSGSGIPNHAFAMLVDGKDFNGYTIKGIGPIKAGAVWYRALVHYLTPTTDFEDAYLALTQSARELIGQFPLDPRTGFPSNKIFTPDDALQVDLALRAVEMNGQGRCGWTVPILRADAPPDCGDDQVYFEDDFESGAAGWTFANSGPLTPYDWELTNDPLPFGRAGVAWFCSNDDIGNCDQEDESGTHALTSPPIQLPAVLNYTVIRFTHHIDVETAWDGGLIKLRVNEGRWHALPTSSFVFNPQNTILRNQNQGNSNPLAGKQAWSGIGSNWGTSVADITTLVQGGDTIQVQFEFGKDGCNGRSGWFVDDFAVYGCGDCNRNDTNDGMDVVFRRSSGPMGRIGVGFPQHFVLAHPPLASEDVLLQFYAIADLFGESQDESLMIYLNGAFAGEVFASGGRDCPTSPDSSPLFVPRDRFNAEAATGSIVVDIVATNSVDPRLCGRTSWVRVDVEYSTTSSDADQNGILDECEICEVVAAPTAAPGTAPANRYLSFVPSPGNSHLAYRIRRVLAGGPAQISDQTRWLGQPIIRRIGNGQERPYSELLCEPYFSSVWANDEAIHIADEFVIPGASYWIDAVQVGCWNDISTDPVLRDGRSAPSSHYSKPLLMQTAMAWGDITGSQGVIVAPDGKVDFLDVSAVVDAFVNAPGAVDLHRCDLAPAIPNGVVDFNDISAALDAYRGLPFPYENVSQACSGRP